MKLFKRMKKVLLLGLIVVCMGVLPVITAFAEEAIPEGTFAPDPAQGETVPLDETEPVDTYVPETDPVPEETYPPETVPEETYPPETQPEETVPEETYAPETTSPQGAGIVENTTYDVNQLPTLVDSTQVAEELPKAIGADADSGGVSYVGGIVCWIAVGISVAVIFAFLISTKGRNKAGIGRYESGNKIGGKRYSDNTRY
ncbi:MAG: hypothetical protein J1F17_07670 [Oscillospiraceae bacterium]|nr:hypothetical protein [Oscillospiraceae bacterium]